MDLHLAEVSCFTACVSLSLTIKSMRNNHRRKNDGAELKFSTVANKSIPQVSPEIRAEMLSRICSFFGEEQFSLIQDAFVIVVGLGGVGSHAVNMLVRSGISKVRIIDFDQVTLSSLNRHALASMSDVGQSKALVVKKRLQEIAPWVSIDAITEMFVGTQADRLLGPWDARHSIGSNSQGQLPTYVLDCIDDVNTKAELIAYCIKHDLRVLTSMGAGGKSDPTRLRVAQLNDCINDPLCQKIKWKLKKHGIAAEDVTGVFSNEKPCVELLPLSDEQAAAPQDYGAVDYLRLRVMPVLGTSPAIFGQAMASKVLCYLGKQEYVPESCERMSKNLKHKLKQTCRSWEGRRFQLKDLDSVLDIDDDDIEFVVAQVWGSRCAISGKRFGGHQPLVLLRWYRDEPPSVTNLVLMTLSAAEQIQSGDKENATPICFEKETIARIEQRLQWAKIVQGTTTSTDKGKHVFDTFEVNQKSIASELMSKLCLVLAAGLAGISFGYAAAVARAFELGMSIPQ